MHPSYLFLLIVIPMIILIYFISLKSRRKYALNFANFEAIARIKGIDLYSKNIVVMFLSILIAFLLIMSVSGLAVKKDAKASSFSYVLAVDSSRSMEAVDFLPTRIDAAKETAIKFVNALPAETSLGIISFSGNSLIEQKMTTNKDLINTAISKTKVSSVGGTDLYEAIITSANLLAEEDAKSIILLSDGQTNVGNLDDAILYANKNDIIIHTIGIGTIEGGMASYGMSKLDEDALKSIAYNTHGKFFKAENKAELLKSFTEIIDLKMKRVTIDLSDYLNVTAIFLFIFEYILANTRYKIFP